MNNFSIDFERLYESFGHNGKILKGLACLQYPIYCIHAEIIDTTPDPLSNIDRVISEFYFENPEFTTLQIAYLIGIPKYLVEQRLSILLSDDLLTNTEKGIELTSLGTKVFKEAIQDREYNRSYDFYIDGITFKPLPRIFYTTYRNKLISEGDLQHYTDYDGKSKTYQPFGPDIVHTPLDDDCIKNELLNIEKADRNDFQIPLGLKVFNDIAFTRHSFPVLIAISNEGKKIVKELIDGFPFYSESQPYYETVRKNVNIFDENLNLRIQNLEFRLDVNQSYTKDKCQLTSNWNEIDRADSERRRCYSFSMEDLLELIHQNFKLSGVINEDVLNEDQEVKVFITKHVLQKTEDKQKLVRNLIRGRDYLFFKRNRYVFLFYMSFDTKDDFITQVIKLKKTLQNIEFDNILKIREIISNDDFFANNYRSLLSDAGEFDLLEKLDIEEFMFKF